VVGRRARAVANTPPGVVVAPVTMENVTEVREFTGRVEAI